MLGAFCALGIQNLCNYLVLRRSRALRQAATDVVNYRQFSYKTVAM